MSRRFRSPQCALASLSTAESGGAGDSGVRTILRQAQGNFAAARIDAPLWQLGLHVGEEFAHQLRNAAAEHDYVWLEQIDHVAEPNC